MPKLIEHYENLLGLAGLISTADGVVRRRTRKEDRVNNLFVQGKAVVLPIYEQLNSPTISERLVFHPFAESSSKGESVLVAELRQRFCASLSLSLMSFFMKCLVFGASKAEHRKLNPIQSEMLDAVRKIEEKNSAAIAEFFTKLLRMPDKKNAAMIQIYLRRDGTVDGKDYARAGVVTFPLYRQVCDELEKTKDRVIEGIKMSEKDLRYIKDLYEYVFPLLKTNPHGYDRGSNSDVAPYMDALMRATASVQVAINERIHLFEKVFSEDEEFAAIPDDWMDAIEALPDLLPEIRLIKVQPGGDGAERVADQLAQQNQMVNANPAPQPQVYHAPQPAPVQTMNPVMQPQPVVQQQYYQPAPVYQPGMQPMMGAQVNLNPHAQPTAGMVYQGGYSGGRGLWD